MRDNTIQKEAKKETQCKAKLVPYRMLEVLLNLENKPHCISLLKNCVSLAFSLHNLCFPNMQQKGCGANKAITNSVKSKAARTQDNRV
jgi:hypothetical protein